MELYVLLKSSHSSYRMMYCLRCRKHTDTKGVTLITLGNGKVAETGECVVCGSKKFRLTSSRSKKVAGGDILTTLTLFVKGITFPGQKYPGEMHYPGASFMRPFTRLDLRLNPDGTPKPDSLPINRVDEAAYRHDLAYSKFSATPTRNVYDKLMVDEINAIEDPTTKERLMRAVATPILLGKTKFGLGLKKQLHWSGLTH